ncbi:MAG TPA: ribbon-helix-helix domain-containing protein [Alphaproteobacteria bacterium]|nr:ribbon-helix-helix domain-containing protein [Alphaproteobacteria bacterium]
MAAKHSDSGLQPRVIWVNGFRTSVRLEPEFWEALEDIGLRETLTRTQLFSFIANRRPGSPLSSAVRVFVATYYGELSGFYRSVWMPKVGNRAAPEVGLEHANLPLTGRRSTARRATALGASRAVPTRTKDREISEH